MQKLLSPRISECLYLQPRLLFLGTSNVKSVWMKLINGQQIKSTSGFKLYIENNSFEYKIKSKNNFILGQPYETI